MRSLLLASVSTLAFVAAPITTTFANAWCGTKMVIVKGRVEHSPPSARVRVLLVYPKDKRGESGEVTVEDGKFTIQIPFLTQSHAPVLMGDLLEKCDRKPMTVVVTLLESDQEFDRVSLSLVKDFQLADPTAFAPRSEVVLNGAH